MFGAAHRPDRWSHFRLGRVIPAHEPSKRQGDHRATTSLPNTTQIVDRLEEGNYEDLRLALPGVSLVQVIQISDEAAFDEACRVTDAGVDGLLLDSGNRRLAVKRLGGTGQTHDWTISRRIREAVKVPVFLAGGLCAENVVAAIQTVRPFGVDVCSGLRSKGWLDEAKLAAFVEAVGMA